MKILHLCDSLNPAGLGGYESYLHYLSEHSVGKGHESLVVTQSPRRNSPESIEREFYTIFHLPGNLLEARKWELFELPEGEREKRVEVLFKENDLELNIEALVGQLQEFIQKHAPDIIHAHSPYVVFNRVLSKLQENGALDTIPMIATIHGRPKPLILPNGERTTDFDSFSDACPFDLVLAVSENNAAILEQYLARKEVSAPVLPLYLGIDLSVFHPMDNVVKKWDVAFMGRLESMKAVDLFPEMLRLLKEHHPNLKFLMTGEGSLKKQLLADFQKTGVSQMVDYQGVVETERVPLLINQSRVFIYPSREEPFGLSILEAMGCGIPVVTTNVFGPKEIITDGLDGIAVAPNDVGELVEAIRKLLENDELRAQIGENGRKTVETRFNIKQHLESLFDIYHDLVISQK